MKKGRGSAFAITQEEITRMKELKAQGLTNRSIAGVVGRASSSVYMHLSGKAYGSKTEKRVRVLKAPPLRSLSERSATIEILVNGRVVAEKLIPGAELLIDPYASFQANCERRRQTVDEYLQQAKESLRELLKTGLFQKVESVNYCLCFSSRMNHSHFKVKGDSLQLKKAS
jgi:hypothetical protein